MAYNTCIQQGSFVSNGTPATIQVRSGVDWIEIYNYTQIAANNVNTGYQFYWQLGMPQGGGLIYESNGAGSATNIFTIAAGHGFTLVDSSMTAPGPKIAITGTTNITQPVVSTGNTAGLSAGSVIRLSGIAAVPNITGTDFTISNVIGNTSFQIANALANVPGAVGGAGFYQVIPYDPIYYPTKRIIVEITNAGPAVVTTSVNHGYVAGQSIRLSVPSQFGMTQANGLLVNIVQVLSPSTFSISLDTTAFSAFVYPGPGAVPFTPAYCNPVGEETDQFSNPNLLDDATINTAYIGVVLGAGILAPAGQNGDFIFWKAGKSFNV
jgi:hypothetical protein